MKLKKNGLVLTAFIFTVLLATSCNQGAQEVWIKGSDLEDSDYLCSASGYVSFSQASGENLYSTDQSLITEIDPAAYGRITWSAAGNSNYTSYTVYAPARYAVLPDEMWIYLYRDYDYNTGTYKFFYFNNDSDEVVLYETSTGTPDFILSYRESNYYYYTPSYLVHVTKSSTKKTAGDRSYDTVTYIDDRGKSLGIPEGASYYLQKASTSSNSSLSWYDSTTDDNEVVSYSYGGSIRFTRFTFETQIMKIGKTYYNSKGEEMDYVNLESDEFTYSIGISELGGTPGKGYATITLTRK